MATLNAENRDTSLKPKQLRRQGIIPGNLYGKNLETSLSIQFSETEVTRFLKSNAKGSKVELAIEGKEYSTLLREVTYRPATKELEHLSFQTLLAGEVVTSAARIVLVNRESVADMIQQLLDEISYRALPSHLIERIEFDVEGMKVGDSIKISDLGIAKNPNIEILSPLDTTVLSIVDVRKPTGEAVETKEETTEAEIK